MKVFKGRLVHSVGFDKPIEVLEDVVIGFQDKTKGGKVGINLMSLTHSHTGLD